MNRHLHTSKKLFSTLTVLATILMPFASYVPMAGATPVQWDLTGVYTINFHCVSGCSGDYPHTVEVTLQDSGTGVFSGTGHYNPDPSYTWNVTGTVSGSTLNFTIVYTGSNPGYTVNATGTIDDDGSLSGGATSSIQQTFTWSSTDGNATEVSKKVSICHATGDSGYQKIEVNENAVDGEGGSGGDHNSDSHQSGRDIIPPGTWDVDGRNWTDDGQAIYNNQCIIPPLPTESSETIVVRAADLGTAYTATGKWYFYNDESDTTDNSLGSFVYGPDVAPLGDGSIQISVSGSQRRNLATSRFGDVTLANLTSLKFSTYNPSVGNGGSANRSGYLQFNVDFDGSNTWQRRLVFVPSGNGTVLQNTWQEWDAINGGVGLWMYSGATWPVTGGAGSTPKTWSQILADYPSVRTLAAGAFFGIRVGEPYADGYTENLDKVVVGIRTGSNTHTTTFDFETPLPPRCGTELGQNGSFEAGTTPGMYTTLNLGDTNIDNWAVDLGSVDYIGSYWQASDGTRSVDLNGLERGSISQMLPTIVGAQYTVSFYLSGNPDSRPTGDPLYSPSLKVVAVSATGVPSQDFSYDTAAEGNTLADMKWQQKSYSFIATATSTVLTFASQIDGAFGPALDNISLKQDCEPAPTPPTCPRGTVETLQETVPVGSDGVTVPSGTLAAGTYILKASGTYVYRPNSPGATMSDAAFSLRDPGDAVYGGVYAPWVSVNSFPSPYQGWLGIQVNPSAPGPTSEPVPWGNVYDSGHNYSALVSSWAGGPMNFRILDDVYSDNSGSLNVGIYACESEQPENGTITILKEVVGGTASVSDFTPLLAGEQTAWGETLDRPHGTYSVGETGSPVGNQMYVATYSALCPNGLIELVGGENVTCTITNTYVPPPCGTELVQNGDFETPEVNDVSHWDIYASDFVGLKWSAKWLNPGDPKPAVANVELQENGAISGWNAQPLGDQYTELDTDYLVSGGGFAHTNSAIELYQDIPTQPGKVYTLTFIAAPRPDAPSTGDNKLEVLWDDVSAGTIDLTTPGWTQYTYTFAAVDSLTRVSFKDAGTLGNSYGPLLDKVSVKENCTSTVKVCKVDGDDEPLSGWQVMLLGEKADTVNVLPDGNPHTSASLTAGPYVFVANGTYSYRPSDPSATDADAAFSKRQAGEAGLYIGSTLGVYAPWANDNDFLAPWNGYLSMLVDSTTAHGWGTVYHSTHRYAQAYTGTGAPASFKILDSAYGDNSNQLSVDIYPGYLGTTGRDGCVTFEDVPVGTYQTDEIMQDGWSYVSGVGEAVVDGLNDVFIITNQPETQPTGRIIIVKNTVGGYGTFEFTIASESTKTVELTTNPETLQAESFFDVFTEIDGTSYTITEDVPTGWKLLHMECDHSEGWENGKIVTVHPGETEVCTFTNEKQSAVSGMKWNDLDSDGVKDSGEPGLPGWAIHISSGDNESIDSTITDADGNYSFTDLAPDDYILCETRQDGWQKTYPSGNTLCQGEGAGHEVTLSPGGSETGFDFGNHNTVQDALFSGPFQSDNTGGSVPCVGTMCPDGRGGFNPGDESTPPSGPTEVPLPPRRGGGLGGQPGLQNLALGGPNDTSTPTPSTSPSDDSNKSNDRVAAAGVIVGVDLCSTGGHIGWWVILLVLAVVLLWFGRRRGMMLWFTIAYVVVMTLWAWQLCGFGFAWLPLILGVVMWFLSAPRSPAHIQQ